MMDFTNTANAVLANKTRGGGLVGVIVLQRSKASGRRQGKMEHDEIGPKLFREFMDLVTPGSGVIMGDFSSIKL
ncbi:MAG TPA: hypothetical protein VE244_02005 [Nitrososphaeraceae archaeon]|jgi:hypothetical protein|nr:hypothetical protein [Nitrososphaeraceae archaeon]